MTIAQRLRKARASVVDAKDELESIRETLLESPHPFTYETHDVIDMKSALVGIAARLEYMTRHHEHISNP